MFGNKKSKIYQIQVSGIEIEVTRKKIKNLYLRVNRGTGNVKVSCPLFISERALLRFVEPRVNWIKERQQKALLVPDRKDYKYITGETHYFQGKPYQLEVLEGNGRNKAQFEGEKLILKASDKSTIEVRQKVIDTLYRSYLKSEIPKLIEKWEPVMGVQVNNFGVRKMRTRWGTCNITAKRIWLSLELAKKTPGCLESVVVHEMVHLLERLHNKRFYAFMDQFYPKWKVYEKELNSYID
ncbi:MAG: SprT family zinc-dependent metalloprotease [Balneolaceae bacterium]